MHAIEHPWQRDYERRGPVQTGSAIVGRKVGLVPWRDEHDEVPSPAHPAPGNAGSPPSRRSSRSAVSGATSMSWRPHVSSRHASSAPHPPTSGTRSASRGRPCITDCITWNSEPRPTRSSPSPISTRRRRRRPSTSSRTRPRERRPGGREPKAIDHAAGVSRKAALPAPLAAARSSESRVCRHESRASGPSPHRVPISGMADRTRGIVRGPSTSLPSRSGPGFLVEGFPMRAADRWPERVVSVNNTDRPQTGPRETETRLASPHRAT